MMQNILLAGATGHLGPYLAKALLEKGNTVYALIRPETMKNKEKTDLLKSSGVHLVKGDLGNQASLEKACENMDAVISAVGGGQILQQEALLKAAVNAGVKRFMPSEFGVDPQICETGTCDLFDMKGAFQQSVKIADIDYTMFYTTGFMEFWASGLGQLGNDPSSGSVQLFGNGDVLASMASMPDIAALTARMVDDPDMANREVSLAANIGTQEDLIRKWEETSGVKMKRTPVSDEQLLEIIEKANTPDQMMTRIFSQLHRSVWIKGDSTRTRPGVVQVHNVYPDYTFMQVESFFQHMARG